MNRLDRLFNVDERAAAVQVASLRRRALAYALLRPSQLKHLRPRDETLRKKAKGGLPFHDGIPWVTYDALRRLETMVTASMHVFEFGAGGSTVFFADRAAHVVSVEHDARWQRLVQDELADRSNIEFVLAQPEPRVPGEEPAALSRNYPDHHFTAYTRSIDRFDDASFDVVLVDGRARVASAQRSYDKVKPGGWLVLDNSERPDYQQVFTDLARAGWGRKDYFGIGPYENLLWQTTVFSRPADDPSGVLRRAPA